MKLRSGKTYGPTKAKKMKITRVVKVKKMSPTLQAQVAVAVKSAIAKNSENKVIGWTPENNTYHNSGITPADCVPLMGKILQGTESYERLGDRITPKRLTIRGVISMRDVAFNTSQNLFARIVIATQKTIKQGVQIGGGLVATGQLLKPNLPTSPQVSFSGNAIEFNYPINTDLFRVYMDKIVKLSPVYTLSPNTSGCPTPSTTFRWSYTFKSLPSSMSFDDAVPDWVNNFAPFLAIGYGYADGSAPDTLAQKLVSFNCSQLSYEDA